jgi:hypothetical protein
VQSRVKGAGIAIQGTHGWSGQQGWVTKRFDYRFARLVQSAKGERYLVDAQRTTTRTLGLGWRQKKQHASMLKLTAGSERHPGASIGRNTLEKWSN